jgi:hypothetical protein
MIDGAKMFISVNTAIHRFWRPREADPESSR